MILQRLGPEHVEQAWPLIEPHIQKLAHFFPDDWPVDRVLDQMKDRFVVPWVVWDEKAKECYGVALTEIVVKPSGRKALNIHVAGHDHREWVRLLTELEEYGKSLGADKVEVIGRTGWERSLPDYQKARLALFSKELGHGPTQ